MPTKPTNGAPHVLFETPPTIALRDALERSQARRKGPAAIRAEIRETENLIPTLIESDAAEERLRSLRRQLDFLEAAHA